MPFDALARSPVLPGDKRNSERPPDRHAEAFDAMPARVGHGGGFLSGPSWLLRELVGGAHPTRSGVLAPVRQREGDRDGSRAHRNREQGGPAQFPP